MSDWYDTVAASQTADIQAALKRCAIRAEVPYGFGGFSIDLGDSVLMFPSTRAVEVLSAVGRASALPIDRRRQAALDSLLAFFPEPAAPTWQEHVLRWLVGR